MGKVGGFLETGRATHGQRDPAARVADYDEFVVPLPDDQLAEQGARCMDCGVPYCHLGQEIERAAAGCPLHNEIPVFNELVYRGHWQQAWENLRRTNPFPEFTGRVCPAPCEGSCVLGINAPPVAIKSIEMAIADRAIAEGWLRAEPPARRTGRRVAVVGSGPAGLACADKLNRRGHLVTVYERADRLGGLLRLGIPTMKLDKKKVDFRLGLMAAEGVRFLTGVSVGEDYPVERLVAEHDAVVLATGSTRPRDLTLAGRDLGGIHFAMTYVTASSIAVEDGSPLPPELSAEGKHVVVIGGGDTGTDCVGTALRQGCKSVTQLEIMAQPPGERAPDNPWPEWPRIFRVDYGQAEARAIFGDDPRAFAVETLAFEGDGEAVSQLRLRGTEDGVERTIPADLVLLALGFVGPEPALLEKLGVTTSNRGNVVAPETKTSTVGVYAAGDCRRGQSLVVWAIAEGLAAADACDRDLMARKGR